MANPLDALRPYLEIASTELEIVVGAVREKGAKRFLRAFVAAGMMIFGSYVLLYVPPQAKSARLDADIQRAKTLHEYGEKYSDLRLQLLSVYARMPAEKEREQWLSNSVRHLLDELGLVTDEFRPVAESKRNGLIFQTSDVEMSAHFSDFYALLLRVESSRPLMHVQKADVTKKTDIDPAMIGAMQLSCQIATVIPEKRF